MSSYRGEVGAWDGGPPGAEADYTPQRATPHAVPLPTTDPWTGVSYSQYGPPQYDYQGFSAPGYGYNYDSTYYQRPDGGYYDSSSNAYSLQQHSNEARKRSRSTRNYDRPRTSYRSKSRSASPYDRKEREYSNKSDSSYEERRRRSRSASKHSNYSSSDRSSYRSRSYSRSPSKKTKNRRHSESSQSSGSGRSYKKSATGRAVRSHTPPLKGRNSHSRNRSYDNEETLKSRSSSLEKDSKNNRRSNQKRSNSKDRRTKDIYTPPRKSSVSPKPQKKATKSSPKTNKKLERSHKKKKNRERKSLTPPRKAKDSSVTPPRCYARKHSSSSSSTRSRSRSLTPKAKHKRSCTPKLRRSRSSSSRSSSSRSDVKRRIKRKSMSKHESRTNSRSRDRSVSKGRSPLRHRSSSRFRRRSRSAKGSKSRSKSRSSRSHSRSRSASPSEDECRGQFTVADRKRFWKMHRSRQENAERSRTPSKEAKPPPGAVESTKVDDIHYGDPPELEGPNFAELLPTPEQILHGPSSSKSKPTSIPIKNDGSFMEMFKKMQEETKKTEEKPIIKKPILPFIGKRRGGRVLKTGLVKKAKAIDEQTVDNTPKDAWSLYMQEVKKYRETSCEEERKTRPLVK